MAAANPVPKHGQGLITAASRCGREELQQRFPAKPWVDVLSKADLLGDEFDAADQVLQAAGPASQQQHEQQPRLAVGNAVQFAAALPAALRVSSTSGEGLDALKGAMLKVLERQPLGQQQGAAPEQGARR